MGHGGGASVQEPHGTTQQALLLCHKVVGSTPKIEKKSYMARFLTVTLTLLALLQKACQEPKCLVTGVSLVRQKQLSELLLDKTRVAAGGVNGLA